MPAPPRRLAGAPLPRARSAPLSAGDHELRFEFEPTGQPDLANGRGAPGKLQLYVDGTLVAEEHAPVTTP